MAVLHMIYRMHHSIMGGKVLIHLVLQKSPALEQGCGCSKLDLNNLGLVKNLNLDMKA